MNLEPALRHPQRARTRCDLTGSAQACAAGLTPLQRDRLLDFVDRNLSAVLRVEHLAAAVAMGPDRFARAFRASFRQPPYAFVLDRRVALAREELRSDPARPLAAIAATCGFANEAHLHQAFRQRVGTTPQRWRRAQGKPSLVPD